MHNNNMDHLRLLEYQFLDESFADVHFIIDTDVTTVKIPSHRVILAAGSLPLSKRFSGNINLKKIEIVNTTRTAFEEFLFTFYSAYPEKNFTIANAHKVLTLAKTFEVIHCIRACERFLLKNLPSHQMCFGYSVASEFGLFDLKAHCMKQINEKKHDVFMSDTFLACDQNVVCDILENLIIDQRDEIKEIWDACVNWAEKQCTMNASDMGKKRELLSKCVNSIASKDGEFFGYVMEHCKELFDNQSCVQFVEKQNELSTASVCSKKDNNENVSDWLVFIRFHETILSPQTCYANVPTVIELMSTKRIALNGLAFSTVTGAPKGKLTFAMRTNGIETILVEQQISLNRKRYDPSNFIVIENFVLEPNTDYIIRAELSKDVVYRSSRRIDNIYHANDFTVHFKASRRDIFSHFSFSEYF